MSDKMTTVRLQLDIAAHHMVSQYMVNNEQIKEDLEKGIANAFENFNFEYEVEKFTRKCIEDAIKSSADWGVLRKKVQEYTDKITDKYIEKAIEKFKKDYIHEV
jgi:intergrase/recombinase